MKAVPDSDILSISSYLNDNKNSDALFFGEKIILRSVVAKWESILPDIRMFYAVKCNPDNQLISYLAMDQKFGFDCATSSEIELLLEKGVSPDRIIYSNPCKSFKDLQYAKENGIKKIVFDCEEELMKIYELIPDSLLVLRIAVKQYESEYAFGNKYGADFEYSCNLIKLSKELNMSIIGLHFHVGCGSKIAYAWYHALKRARKLFDYAENEHLYFTLLDIGGGYMPFFENEECEDALKFESAAEEIQRGLTNFFSDNYRKTRNISVVAEPGRYICQRVFTLAVSVINKKKYSKSKQILNSENLENADMIMYYVNQGIYSSLNITKWVKRCPLPNYLLIDGKTQIFDEQSEGNIKSIVWGHSCDRVDCVFPEILLPELNIGDWMIFSNFGAYSISMHLNSDGFLPINCIWLD